MTLEKNSLVLLREALDLLDQGFDDLAAFEAHIDPDRLREVLCEVAARMQDNFPYQHPLYAGQMLKPPHPVARLAYMLAMWINPNNHALDGGRASSQMEKEAVADLAAMFGWQTHLGHLTSGGTMANLEALWVAGRLHPGKTILASQQAHYTHSRICGVLQIPSESVPVDSRGRLDIHALETRLKAGDVGTVVATMGATATGAVDPLGNILMLREQYRFRLHADAAYGGYFTLVDNLTPETWAAFDFLGDVDSLAIDPHKHGLQPYGCGCILFQDPSVGRFYKHDSPYTYFSSDELHLGEISLECSRAGAAAVGLWATHRLLPPVRGGEFAASLRQGRDAALKLYEKLQADPRFVVAFPPELDIVVWGVRASSAGEMSRLARAVFAEAERHHLYLAVANLPAAFFAHHADIDFDQDTVACLRSCLMKPEHLDWLDRIWHALDAATTAVLGHSDG